MEFNQGFGKCQIHLSTEYPGLHILLMQFLPTILCVLSPRNFWKSKSPKPVTSGPLWAVKKTFSLAHKFRSRTEKCLDRATIPFSTQAFLWEPGASPCLLLLLAPRTWRCTLCFTSGIWRNLIQHLFPAFDCLPSCAFSELRHLLDVCGSFVDSGNLLAKTEFCNIVGWLRLQLWWRFFFGVTPPDRKAECQLTRPLIFSKCIN